MKTKFEVFRDVEGQWCWHAKRKGRIVADGGESYKRRPALLKSLRAFLASIRKCEYVLADEED